MRSTFQEVAITQPRGHVSVAVSEMRRSRGDTTARSAAVLDATARDAECAVDARQVLSAQRALPSETSATERLPSAAFPLSESEAVVLKSGYLFKEIESTLRWKQHWYWCVRPRCARLLQRRDLSRDAELASSMLRCVHRTP